MNFSQPTVQRVTALNVEIHGPEGALMNRGADKLLRDAMIYTQYDELRRRRNFGFIDQTIDNAEASIPPPGVMNYPPDWPTISFQRGKTGGFAENPEDRRILGQIGIGAATVDEHTRRVTVPSDGGAKRLGTVIRELDEAGIAIDDIGLRRPTLDDVFLTLTGRAAEVETVPARRPR